MWNIYCSKTFLPIIMSTTKKPRTKRAKSPKASSVVLKPDLCSGIYFDNNGTTLMCKDARDAFARWAACYNPSSDSRLSIPAKEMLEAARRAILSHCRVDEQLYTVLFTSGGTESNSTILHSTVLAYRKKSREVGSKLLPHIITSSIEHHSILETLHVLQEYGGIEVTQVAPTIHGNILPKAVEAAIKPNTCLISIMYANNEIGSINNISEIVRIAHRHRIPVHSDCVQIFGKYRVDLAENPIDAISVSSHKFYGPKGVGLLLLRNNFISGYKLPSIISGTQQGGLRGGTENMAGVAACVAALRHSFVNRREKNVKLMALRNQLIDGLGSLYTIGSYGNYVGATSSDGASTSTTSAGAKAALEIVVLGPDRSMDKKYLPNTVLLSIAKNTGVPFCNIKLKKFLDEHRCTVSVGSACMTASPTASHVLVGIGAPPVIKRGVLRVSFGDTNTSAEVSKFLTLLAKGVELQCKADSIDL